MTIWGPVRFDDIRIRTYVINMAARTMADGLSLEAVERITVSAMAPVIVF